MSAATMTDPALSDLGSNVTVLTDGDRTYYLVGTAHVSKESVEEVRRVIAEVRPDTVCVELCETRYKALTDPSRWRNLDVFQVIKQGKTLFLLANLAIGAHQRRLGAELGVKPGAELLAATEAAEAIGAKVELVDRDIQVTLKRTWRRLGFFKKYNLFGAIVGSMFGGKEEIDAATIEQLKEKAHLSEMLAEFAKALPEVKEPLIDERDQYLMSSIEDAPGKRIVAVVGAAHVPGMQTHFKQPIDRAALDEVPPKARWTGLIKWIIPAIILVAFWFGLSDKGGQSFEQMLWAWILPNSVLCALLTALAGGSLLAIVTGFVASPITSLNPLIGAGIVVGLVEAWRKKPTVTDIERVNEDTQSLRGFYRNKFTRVLLVTIAATLGSALGAWVGLGWLVSLVA